EEARRAFVAATQSVHTADRQALRTAGLVLSDLCSQGWLIRTRKQVVQVRPPDEMTDDRAAEKGRIRQQELVKRDAQLRKPAARKFIQTMERTRLHEGRFVSVFSLMRDGRELAEKLAAARAHDANGWADALQQVIDPYLQFVTDTARCEQTGFRLMDIWRYFRHTWTNQYTSVPGRSMMFIVRDAAAEGHPVVGIGSLASPVVQIRERDTWIGWHPDVFLREVRESPTADTAQWLIEVVDRAVEELYVADLIEDGILTPQQLRKPSAEVIARLIAEGGEQRALHHRFAKSQNHKRAAPAVERASHWQGKARTHLFRSKRALALADYLQARELFHAHLGASPTADALCTLARTTAGANVIRKVVKKAKADKIGISVADISVCGAVQPYNAILGGKLVSMLATSPEVVDEYRRRYSEAESEIASSMAGRGIVRPSELVLLGTTSLYGTGSSQYNRVRVPCERIGGQEDTQVRFEDLGHSEAFGTSQYSDETVAALCGLIEQAEDGQRVNSIFGEGVSPRLRKVRQGLDLLDFPSEVLLKHHRRRVVYGVTLIRNLRRYLLGMDGAPDYLISSEDGSTATSSIAAWWRERWLRRRIEQDRILEEVAAQTLVRPVRHGARVELPTEAAGQVTLFDARA
ncbi:MAG: Druantia anti-phage system protein DruA, partial [Dehalococcoidia bacterium]